MRNFIIIVILVSIICSSITFAMECPKETSIRGIVINNSSQDHRQMSLNGRTWNINYILIDTVTDIGGLLVMAL